MRVILLITPQARGQTERHIMVSTGIYYLTEARATLAANRYIANGTKAVVKRSIQRVKDGRPSYVVCIAK